MANKNLPFDEDTMTLIMGIGGPGEPGQHGRMMIPAPNQKAIDIITQIRDLCEDFLNTVDKNDEESEGETDTEDLKDMSSEEE